MATKELVSDMGSRSERAVSFGGAARIYERARPSYPEQAVDWLIPGHTLPHGRPKIVDLGAGTGKLTRMIAARGLDVTAVEPSAGMREQFREALPGVTTVQGTAEEIPFETSSLDAVLVAQAWHWVDVPRASVEVARVLKPGGRLGLIWNTRDERVDWVRELSDVTGRDAEPMERANPDFGEPFGQIEYLVTEWHAPMTRTALIELVASRSRFIVASPDDQAHIRESVLDLLDQHPQLTGRDVFEMPYVTYSSRAHVA